jgi:hypothetical protein
VYFREFTNPPETIIRNGKANFRTYNGVCKKFSITGMKAPYAGIPLPTFLSRLRIKSRLNYIFSLDKIFGRVDFFDFKVFGLAEVILWEKETSKKYVYHTFMLSRKRFVPRNTIQASCTSHRKARFIKISWQNNHKDISLKFKLKGDDVRPSASGLIHGISDSPSKADLMFVNPSPVSSRCSATWMNTMNVRGKVLLNLSEADNSTGLAAFVLNRTYFKLRSHTKMLYSLGKVKGKDVFFTMQYSNLDAANADLYNNNVLIVDGKPTALPSVIMTHPFGIDKNWIIQDTESMVDLTFVPSSVTQRTLNIIAMRTSYSTIYGTFEGTLLTSEGEKITLRSLPGILYTAQLRI